MKDFNAVAKQPLKDAASEGRSLWRTQPLKEAASEGSSLWRTQPLKDAQPLKEAASEGRSLWRKQPLKEAASEGSSLWRKQPLKDAASEGSSLWRTQPLKDAASEGSSLWRKQPLKDAASEGRSLWRTQPLNPNPKIWFYTFLYFQHISFFIPGSSHLISYHRHRHLLSNISLKHRTRFACSAPCRESWRCRGGYLTGAARPVPLSSGSGCSATCCPGGARPESPPTGWSAAGPVRPRTGSGGCKRCRRRPLRSGGRGGWGWSCGWVCCSWPKLKKMVRTRDNEQDDTVFDI